jgi:spore germination protein KC
MHEEIILHKSWGTLSTMSLERNSRMRSLSLPLFILILVFLTGCWNRVEINDLAIESMLGVDLADRRQIRIIAQIVNPPLLTDSSPGDPRDRETGQAYFVLTQEGSNPSECSSKLQEKLSRQFIVAHRRVVIIGDKLARSGIQNVLDHLSRDPGTRLDTFILVADHMEASRLLSTPDYLEKMPSEAVLEIEHSNTGLAIDMKDFLLMCATEGTAPVAATIRATRKGFELSGTAVFRDYKLIGYLNDEQTRALMWLRDEMKKGVVTIDSPGTNKKISVNILRAKTKLKPSIQNGHVHMDVYILTEGNISENNSNLNLFNPKNIEKIEQQTADQIRACIRQTIGFAQKQLQADIFKFGQIVYKKLPNEWETLRYRWGEEFPKTEVTLHIKVNIRQIGMLGQGLELKEEEIQK